MNFDPFEEGKGKYVTKYFVEVYLPDERIWVPIVQKENNGHKLALFDTLEEAENYETTKLKWVRDISIFERFKP